MRLRDDEFFHLTYCSNIHPGESWMEVFTNLEIYGRALKSALAPDRPFGLGLRLSDLAARELLADEHLNKFRKWLHVNDIYVFTINGFPYGGFHRQVVKDDVYRPDWTDPERVAYTLRLADILARLLPEGVDGGISTSPVSYKRWHGERERDAIFLTAARHFAEVTAHLVSLRQKTGRFVHIDIEPEPDCLIENTEETLGFYERWLLPEGGAYLSHALRISLEEAHALLLEHIQLCYDACHFAVEFEEPAYALAQLTAAGIRIGKIQISSAVKVAFPEDAGRRGEVLARLREFEESTYLHQVVVQSREGALTRYPDLSDALTNGKGAAGDEWRVHFHVPVFVDAYGALSSTRDELEACLRLAKAEQISPHLEIETYTWEVLPDELKSKMSTSILREYAWVLSVLGEEAPEIEPE